MTFAAGQKYTCPSDGNELKITDVFKQKGETIILLEYTKSKTKKGTELRMTEKQFARAIDFWVFKEVKKATKEKVKVKTKNKK